MNVYNPLTASNSDVVREFVTRKDGEKVRHGNQDESEQNEKGEAAMGGMMVVHGETAEPVRRGMGDETKKYPLSVISGYLIT